VSRFVLVLHQEKDVATATDEEDLHEGVVEGYPSIKDVKVARHEY